jgi:hypothetical protein
MAGTDDDNSTSVDWLQLYAVRALVARELQITPLEAEELILEYASRGHFRRCGGSGSYIDPRHWGASHPELGVYIPVDFNRGVVRHICLPAADATRYTLRLALDDHLEPYMDRSNTEMREACLARDDVLSMLRELGVPPERAQADEPLTSEGAEESKSISAPEAKPESAPASKPQLAKRVTLKNWLPDAVVRWPRDKVNADDYPKFLQLQAPQPWKKHSIQNELSILAKERPELFAPTKGKQSKKD